MKERFIEFLEEKGVKDKYFDYLKEYGEDPDMFFDEVSPNGYLTTAFIWERTKEGLEYWFDLNNEWVELLNKEETN